MIKLLFILVFSFQGHAALIIDPKYDNYEGAHLILKLIEDNQWTEANLVFDKEKSDLIARTPSDFSLILGLLDAHDGKPDSAIDKLTGSLNIRYSDLAFSNILKLYSSQKNYGPGYRWLEKFQHQSIAKISIPSELEFLKKALAEPDQQTQGLNWLESYLKQAYSFHAMKLYVDTLLKNQVRHEAGLLIENALIENKIKSSDEVLILAESFLASGLESEVHHFLERARLQFPRSDLIKLNLSQVLFKKEMNVSALNLLSEIKSDDGLLSVKLELMNLMRIKSYSLFHLIHLQNTDLYLKNSFAYLINNENWAILYSLHPAYPEVTKWANDDFNYAMAYSAQFMTDSGQARLFINRVQSPALATRKAKLVESLRL